MSDNPFRNDVPSISWQYSPLPAWLASRLLRADEQVVWVRGPRWNPWWEGYVTHIGLFFVALLLGGTALATARLSVGSWSEIPTLLPVVCAGLVLGTLLVLGLSAGYFTRLVVTNYRIVILQGYEVCRSWSLDQLPRSLLRYRKTGSKEESPTIDVEALQTMLGGSEDGFADPKTILSLGKHLDRIKGREDGRP